MKSYRIRISTAHETASATCIAANQAQAWETAFDLAERLLGSAPQRHRISVRPTATAAVHQPRRMEAA